MYPSAMSFDHRVRFDGPELGLFYYYQPGEAPEHVHKDEQGFATIEVYGRWHRQPLTQAQWAMTYFHRFLEHGQPEDRRRFIEATDLLIGGRTTRTLDGQTCDVWEYGFEYPTYAPHPVPWISAITQGRAIAVLARAYQMTGGLRYLQCARNACAVYDVDVDDGGIRATDEQGSIYYEEYPFPGRCTHVLNGFISSILGAYDLYRSTGDERAQRLFEQGISTLCAPGVLQRYDTGYWSAYDQKSRQQGRPTSLHYHRLHVRQLAVLHRITGREVFLTTYHRWFRYGLSRRNSLRNSMLEVRYHFSQTPRYWRKLRTG